MTSNDQVSGSTFPHPFHYLGVKWLLPKCGWCYLEAMEVKLDVRVLHSVDLKESLLRKVAIQGQLLFIEHMTSSSGSMLVDGFSCLAFRAQ